MSRIIKSSISFYILVFFVFSADLTAQINNGDFEEWLTCLCDPPGWYTNNIYTPFEFILVNAGEPYTGLFSATGKVDSSNDLGAIFPPLLISERIDLDYRPARLEGYFKFHDVGTDRFSISLSLLDNVALIGQGGIILSETREEYTHFAINIEYRNNDTPAYAEIGISILPPEFRNEPHIGSQFWVDEIMFSDTAITSVKSGNTPLSEQFELFQNYPNPFNNGTSIKYNLPAGSNVRLKVYDNLGKEVITLIDKFQNSGLYTVYWEGKNSANKSLPSGVYYYNLTTETKSQSKAMIFLK